MARIKLPNAGDTLTTRVIKAEVVESQANGQEQVKFTTEHGDIYIGRDTAERQLGRCGFATEEGDAILYSDVDGAYLTFFRTANKNPSLRPYWNIKRADSAEPARGMAPKAKDAPKSEIPVQVGEAMTEKRNAIEAAYRRAWEVAKAVQGNETSFEAIQAGAATLFISYKDNALLPMFVTPKTEPPKPAPQAKPAISAKKPAPTFEDDPMSEEDDELPF